MTLEWADDDQYVIIEKKLVFKERKNRTECPNVCTGLNVWAAHQWIFEFILAMPVDWKKTALEPRLLSERRLYFAVISLAEGLNPPIMPREAAGHHGYTVQRNRSSTALHSCMTFLSFYSLSASCSLQHVPPNK